MLECSELLQNVSDFATVIPECLQRGRVLVLDMNDHYWHNVNISDPYHLWDKTRRLMSHYGADIAVGRYGEDRQHIYRRSPLFVNANSLRSVHLGVDLMVKPLTPVYAPLAGVIHSFACHSQYGDYGPTLLVRHQLQGTPFYTLYGHLSKASMSHWQQGQSIDSGSKLGEVGNIDENGQWPPHLHFQIISNLLGYETGFPGVATTQEAQYYMHICPNPNVILRMPELAINPYEYC
jgi:murein DD-endopeptidase MepM/ murein hydrolase activator NlpD